MAYAPALFGVNAIVEPFVRPVLLNPFGVAMMTWGVVVVELFLMMGLVATRPVRKVLLAFGLLLHFGILILQGLGSFSVTMFGALVLYLWLLDEPLPLGRLSAAIFKRVSAARPPLHLRETPTMASTTSGARGTAGSV